MKHKLLLITLILILALEISVTIVVYNIFLAQEHQDKKDLLDITTEIISNNINSTNINYVHDIAKRAAVFRLLGPYISPSDFEGLARSDLAEIPVSSERWIPFVRDENRTFFESYYGQYYNNFTIRDISFNGTINTFVVSKAPSRPFYYPFAISIPPFTLTPMGGDFNTNSPQFSEILVSPDQPSFSSRVTLSRPNNDIDYGIYLQYFVSDNGHPIGVVSNLIIPSENIQLILQRQKIDQSLLKIHIYDARRVYNANPEDALIYRYIGSSAETNQQQLYTLLQRRNTYTITIQPLLYIIEYADIFTSSIETELPLLILISFILLSFMTNLIVIVGYIFYYYKSKAVEYDKYREILDFINHELRNPLNAMIGSIKFLIEKIKNNTGISNEFLEKNLLLCESQCNLMIYIIERMKSMKSIIEGRSLEAIHDLKINKVILEDVIVMTNTIVQGRVEEHGYISYDVIYSCDRSMILYLDKNRLVEVLSNIVDNAIKYSKPDQDGQIIMMVACRDNHLTFKIQDTGIGIPDNMRGKLFQPYTRVNNNVSISGTGLGLYYCKAICEKMGGNISYISKVNVGTTFNVTIPCGNTDVESTSSENFSILNMDTTV